MDLDHLINKVSKLLNEESGIVLYSDQTQSLTGSKGVILWNSSPANITEDIYNEFKDELKTSTAKFYNMTNVLPYVDFCIALLCSSGYSLNHTTTKSVLPRVFVAAWRTIYVKSKTNNGEMAQWLRKHIQGRSAKGYTIAFDLDMDSGVIPIRTNALGKSDNKYKIRDIIEDATLSGEVVDIVYHGQDNLPTPKVFSSTSMPEGQLFDLRIVHEVLTKDWKH